MNLKTEAEKRKSGFVTIVGLPNVGKSTLMNKMIGQKIAITSYKPQTTRSRIRTIYTDERGQIVFLDTPGIKKIPNKLGEYMYKVSTSSIGEVDIVLFMCEVKKAWSEEDEAMLALLQKAKGAVFLVVNKIDKVKEEDLLPFLQKMSERFRFTDVFPVSARTGDGVEALMEALFQQLPEGEAFYDEELVTTQTEREITAEIIREKALRLLQEEVPHGIAVSIERMKERTTKAGEPITDIEASIICEKESHKGIIIGRQGAMLKKIGAAARGDIEAMLQQKANLKLFVKVRDEWRDSGNQLKSFGYDITSF
ncbi:MAG: GTPase Era [Lachnospiraceae bacterium]|nr:GTPase Era [Lachnospiraceae bacterium]